MIPEIYTIQTRGEIVNTACQWIARHLSLGLKLAVAPIMVCLLVAFVDYAFIKSYVITVIAIVMLCVIIPVVPNLLLHVVENADEFGYPERRPTLRELVPVWWLYFRDLLAVVLMGCVLYVVSGITIIGPMLVSIILPFAVVVKQRDEYAGVLGCFLISAKLIIRSFGEYIVVMLSISIINISMVVAPMLAFMMFFYFLREFVSADAYNYVNNMLGGDSVTLISVSMAVVGAVFATMISQVILHFFYGHAIEKRDHISLADRLNNFQ